MNANQILVLSLPRSGSTVLTNIMSRKPDVLCLPESFFPGLLDWLDDDDWNDDQRMAALFRASCSDGSPLSMEEARACMRGGPGPVLEALASRIAEKDGRDPSRLKAVVWKSTRLVGSHKTTDMLGWRYLILKRPELNVYESQFRVPFGIKNRNPRRFALFAASYEAAFRTYDASRTRHLSYAAIPEEMGHVLEWIGSDAKPGNGDGSRLLLETVGSKPWHAAISGEFRDEDRMKLANLDARAKEEFEQFRGFLEKFPRVGRISRFLADRRQAMAIRAAAARMRESI